MAFTIYKSTDASAPVLSGSAGALLTVLDAILVNGYGGGGGQPAAGWTKPYSNSGNIGCYKNSTTNGTGMCLSVNDNGPHVTATFREARLTGYESMSSVSTGSGQFPLASANQGISPYGFLAARKSNNADGNARTWICFADSHTFYFFTLTNDTAGRYLAFWFGDIYSVGGAGDAYRAVLCARTVENSGVTGEEIDQIRRVTGGNDYMPRTVGGGGTSILTGHHGDAAKAQMNGQAVVAGAAGIQSPNSADNAYYLAPMWIHETVGITIRGRARGLWHVCHPYTAFSDGQTFSGANETAGKTFQIVLTTGSGGCVAMETSDTLETN